MMSIFSDYVEIIIEVFIDDFTMYGDSFDKCLEKLSRLKQKSTENYQAKLYPLYPSRKQ